MSPTRRREDGAVVGVSAADVIPISVALAEAQASESLGWSGPNQPLSGPRLREDDDSGGSDGRDEDGARPWIQSPSPRPTKTRHPSESWDRSLERIGVTGGSKTRVSLAAR